MGGMTRQAVDYADVLGVFTARTTVRSTLGAQLDALRDGVNGGSADAKRAQERTELALLRDAAVLRCVDGLSAYKSIRFCWAPDLRKVASRTRLTDGEVAIAVLYAFQPWATQWPERGLVAVHDWIVNRSGSKPEGSDADEMAQAFRSGKFKRSRTLAAACVSDAHAALACWVGIYNRAAHASNAAGGRYAA